MHVIWDWNGTLLDDADTVVDALNHVLDASGIDRIDARTYQRLYTRPVNVFYERVFGRPIDDDEWAHVDELFHVGYRAAFERLALNGEAVEVLDRVEAAGHTQSLLSMYPHDELLPLVDRFGLTGRFSRIDGVRGSGGGSKTPAMQAHLTELGHGSRVAAGQVVVVGDALDDAAAARRVGAHCVLYDGGAHPRAELEATGMPVASTLTEALLVAGFD